jgi:preprotein translocase subunit YajC
MNRQTIEMEPGTEIVSTDGMHGQIVGCERGTFRVQWNDGERSTQWGDNGEAMVSVSKRNVDMEDAR